MIQVAANALATAASYLLVGIGFSLMYTTSRFFNFAHAAVITVGAYATFVAQVWLSMPVVLAVLIGVFTSAITGAATELSVYRPLRQRATPAGVLLVVSLGVYVGALSILSLLFGASARTLGSGVVTEAPSILGARLTVTQFGIIGAGLAGWVGVWLFLEKTLTGKLMRAVGCDPDLAYMCGFDRDWIVLIAMLLGSSLAGIAGILLAYDAGLTPHMGFQVLLGGVVAVVIGGVGNIGGIALGGLLLGLAQHYTAWWISSAWQDVVVFGILVAFLFVRPEGFLGASTGRGQP